MKNSLKRTIQIVTSTYPSDFANFEKKLIGMLANTRHNYVLIKDAIPDLFPDGTQKISPREYIETLARFLEKDEARASHLAAYFFKAFCYVEGESKSVTNDRFHMITHSSKVGTGTGLAYLYSAYAVRAKDPTVYSIIPVTVYMHFLDEERHRQGDVWEGLKESKLKRKVTKKFANFKNLVSQIDLFSSSTGPQPTS